MFNHFIENDLYLKEELRKAEQEHKENEARKESQEARRK